MALGREHQRHTWMAPRSMIMSFKLGTDPSLLAKKARYGLEKYSHHLVIGNLLNTRKWKVLFVSADGGELWIRVPAARRSESVTNVDFKHVHLEELAIEIESWIVPEVAKEYTAMREKTASKQ
ncbi:Phosphopantothenate--cysteine ligase cab2 [Elasticomyces elasticus]|nr:Phosphopantothenate--cysteine ligase cab2 [Elasticomyces elasticus]